MHWRKLGAGTPVIMAHKLAASPWLWRFVMPRIKHASCLVWEMIGYGGSIPQGANHNLSAEQ